MLKLQCELVRICNVTLKSMLSTADQRDADAAVNCLWVQACHPRDSEEGRRAGQRTDLRVCQPEAEQGAGQD